MLEPKIISENEDFIIIDKPSGWVVNEAGTVKGVPILQSWLSKNFDYETAKDREYRSGIVHRLDKETSGVILVAKTRRYFKYLQSLFKNRLVIKSYLALLHGELVPKNGVLEAPVGRLPWNRKRFGVLPGGRSAITAYKVLSYFEKDGNKFSYIEFYPKTGRTHQIRIHAKHLGHPIVSDSFYAGRKTARLDRAWCPRLFLHANKIEFKHKDNNEKVILATSTPPQDLSKALEELEKIKLTN